MLDPKGGRGCMEGLEKERQKAAGTTSGYFPLEPSKRITQIRGKIFP